MLLWKRWFQKVWMQDHFPKSLFLKSLYNLLFILVQYSIQAWFNQWSHPCFQSGNILSWPQAWNYMEATGFSLAARSNGPHWPDFPMEEPFAKWKYPCLRKNENQVMWPVLLSHSFPFMSPHLMRHFSPETKDKLSCSWSSCSPQSLPIISTECTHE